MTSNKTNRTRTFAFLALVLCWLLPWSFTAAAATESEEVHDVYTNTTFELFNTEAESVISSIQSGGDINSMAWALWAGFSVIALSGVVLRFMSMGLHMEDIATVCITIMIAVLLMAMYGQLTTWTWGFGDGVGLGVQEIVFDNRDSFFLAKMMGDQIAMIEMDDVGFFDSAMLVLRTIQCMACIVIIQAVSYLASLWAIWGYALSKVIGFIFIPFIILDVTKPFFDGWVKLFLGFVAFNMILKVNMVFTAKFFLSAITSMADPNLNTADGATGAVLLGVAILSVLSMFSAGSLAQLIVGGFASSGMSKGISGGVRMLAKALA